VSSYLADAFEPFLVFSSSLPEHIVPDTLQCFVFVLSPLSPKFLFVLLPQIFEVLVELFHLRLIVWVNLFGFVYSVSHLLGEYQLSLEEEGLTSKTKFLQHYLLLTIKRGFGVLGSNT